MSAELRRIEKLEHEIEMLKMNAKLVDMELRLTHELLKMLDPTIKNFEPDEDLIKHVEKTLGLERYAGWTR